MEPEKLPFFTEMLQLEYLTMLCDIFIDSFDSFSVELIRNRQGSC